MIDHVPEHLVEVILNNSEICISKERMAHSHGVAELMYKYHDMFGCKDLGRRDVYLLGLLHDFGYIGGAMGHEVRGANIIGDLFHADRTLFYECLYYHECPPKEYLKATGRKEAPKELILLWWANMMVESGGNEAGEVVGFAKRLQRIKKRFGEKSREYTESKAKVDWLLREIESDNKWD